MRTHYGISTRLVLPALLGSALLGIALLGSRSAQAQGAMTPDTPQADPDSLRYPYAAPNGLQLYHWSDYTGKHLRTGSAYGARLENERMERERVAKMKASPYHFTEDDVNNLPQDPDTPDYPFSGPGGIELYHWSDYTGVHLVTGSAYGARLENERYAYLQRMSEGSMREDESMADPDSIRYPYAAPNSLQLYHWSDYTGMHLRTGSAYGTRLENERMEREKMEQKMQQ